jgi:hypothetical protein
VVLLLLRVDRALPGFGFDAFAQAWRQDAEFVKHSVGAQILRSSIWAPSTMATATTTCCS